MAKRQGIRILNCRKITAVAYMCKKGEKHDKETVVADNSAMVNDE